MLSKLLNRNFYQMDHNKKFDQKSENETKLTKPMKPTKWTKIRNLAKIRKLNKNWRKFYVVNRWRNSKKKTDKTGKIEQVKKTEKVWQKVTSIQIRSSILHIFLHEHSSWFHRFSSIFVAFRRFSSLFKPDSKSYF